MIEEQFESANVLTPEVVLSIQSIVDEFNVLLALYRHDLLKLYKFSRAFEAPDFLCFTSFLPQAAAAVLRPTSFRQYKLHSSIFLFVLLETKCGG